MMVDLPLAIFVDINKRVPSRHFLPSGAHGERVDSDVRTPIRTSCHVALLNLALRFQFQKVHKVILNARKVRAWRIADRRQQDAALSIARCNLLRIFGRQGIVPKAEQGTNLGISDGFAHGNFLWHYTGMVVLDLPDAVFLHVVVSVSGLDLVASSAHGELVNASIGSPSISNVDFALEDFTLWLLEKKRIEVIFDGCKVCARLVRHGGEQDRRLGVPTGHDSRVSCGQGGIP
mmetsp:Transcript_23473/g.49137  ORF Transcript_23473/g.49137 Transcript_23473/m.49137 type:complete len:233 (-) Transcript_23473:425-1123(-)